MTDTAISALNHDRGHDDPQARAEDANILHPCRQEFHRLPWLLSGPGEDLRRYQLQLASRGVSVARQNATVTALISTPITRPSGPTSWRAMKASLPAPEPRSSTVFPAGGPGGSRKGRRTTRRLCVRMSSVPEVRKRLQPRRGCPGAQHPHHAQQESFFTSLSKIRAASFRPSTVVR